MSYKVMSRHRWATLYNYPVSQLLPNQQLSD